MRRRLALSAALALLASVVVACSSPARPPSAGRGAPTSLRARSEAAPLRDAPLSPARYVLTQDMGALFDEAAEGSTMAQAEPAIVDGARMLLDAGVVVATAKGEPRFSGFRSLPARLGGGYVLWSDEATYKADAFLGPLRRIIDVPASRGARPWLSSVLLRTARGVLELDPKTLAVRRLPPAVAASLIDGIAVDDRRAVRVSAVGRAGVTLDGGARFEDITESRGFFVSVLHEMRGGATLMSPWGQPELQLAPGGELGPLVEGARPSSRYYAPPSLEVTASQSLAPPEVAHAAAAGALLPGDRALVARRSGLRLFSTRSARAIEDEDLRGVSEWLARCQPVVSLAPSSSAAAEDDEILLACAHARGAHVLRITGDMALPALAAASSDRGGFVVGARGRLGFAGRIGAEPPSAAEFARNTAAPPAPGDGAGGGEPASPWSQGEMGEPQEPPAAPPPEDASPKAPQDDAFFSVYRGGGRWSEHRVGGRYAKQLFRWIPADDGSAVALVVKASDKESEGDDKKSDVIGPGTASPGVRVVEIDPADEALRGGSLAPALAPAKDPPYRSVDPDFWIDEGGSIRGWARLPLPDGGSRDERPSGGPVAGVRIDFSGKITLFSLPKGTAHVVRGGRFGLAMASSDEAQLYFETTDGGETWPPVAAPPVGRIEPPDDAAAPFACSALGCALGGGLVRLGFGGSPPDEPKPSEDAPAAPINPPIPDPVSIVVVCTAADDEAAVGPEKDERGSSQSAPISVRTQTSGPLGRASKGVWSVSVLDPFQPAARPRSITVRDASIGAPLHGQIVPLLAGDRAGAAASGGRLVDLALLTDKGRVRLGAPSPSIAPFDYGGRVAALAEGPEGALVGIDADRGFIVLSRGGAARPVARISRVDDASQARLTLAKRLDPKAPEGALAVVTYSTSSGDVAAGWLDLGRAEIGPLRALGSLASMEEASAPSCAPERLLVRFVADLRLGVRLRTKGGRALAETTVTTSALLAASPDHICVEGLELRLPEGARSEISARFPARGPASAAARGPGSSVALSCSLER